MMSGKFPLPCGCFFLTRRETRHTKLPSCRLSLRHNSVSTTLGGLFSSIYFKNCPKYCKKKTPKLDEIAQEKFRKTSALLGVDIEYLLDKKPTHLSGGERQRVALGRCITRDPALFLLDEPFSNLDQKLQEKYRVQLKKLLRQFNITTVYVTHDQQEALILADVLTIMNIGRIEQMGTPEDIYNSPHSLFVAEFLNLDGDTPAINLLEGRVISQNLKGLLVGVRSQDIELCEKNTSAAFPGTIVDIRQIPLKSATILGVKIGENELYVRLPLK